MLPHLCSIDRRKGHDRPTDGWEKADLVDRKPASSGIVQTVTRR